MSCTECEKAFWEVVKEYDRKGMIGGVNMDDLMWKVLGAALKGTVSGYLSKIVGGMVGQISPDIIAAALGYYMNSKMSGNWKAFGEGLLIAAVAQIVAPMVSGLTAGLTQAPAPASSTTTTSSAGVYTY